MLKSYVTFDPFMPIDPLLWGAYEGMSGGPVLLSGKVVGVIVRGPSEDNPTIPFLAAKSEFVVALLATIGVAA